MYAKAASAGGFTHGTEAEVNPPLTDVSNAQSVVGLFVTVAAGYISTFNFEAVWCVGFGRTQTPGTTPLTGGFK